MIFSEFILTDGVFKYIGRDWATPTFSAFTAAHDMVEHFPNDKGVPEDEMRALGCGLWLRQAMAHESGSAVSNVIGNDITFTMDEYKIDHIRPAYGWDSFELPAYLQGRWNDMVTHVKAHDLMCKLNHTAVQEALRWARIGLRDGLERYSGCNTLPETYMKLRNQLHTYRFNWYTTRLCAAVDPKYGTIEIENKRVENPMIRATTWRDEMIDQL